MYLGLDEEECFLKQGCCFFFLREGGAGQIKIRSLQDNNLLYDNRYSIEITI